MDDHDKLMQAFREDTLKAITKGKELLRSLSGKTGKAVEALHESTNKAVEKLEKELARWEEEHKKHKGKT